MATKQELGRLHYEDPRSVWADEARDFTPWLMEHIGLLNAELGWDIAIEGREGEVGAFSVDLYGREVGTEHAVVVENQLEQSNHDHLGKLITYAAGRGAKIALWVAPDFREEHLEAIRWLNSQSSERVDFYAVRIRLLSIDGSPSAPHFAVLEGPRVGVTRPPNAYYRFHASLLEQLNDASSDFSYRTPTRSPYLIFNKGLPSPFRFATAFQRRQFEVELVIETRDGAVDKAAVNGTLFDRLLADRAAIEGEIGQTLEWDRENHGRDAARVFAFKPGTIDSPPEELEEFKQWSIDLLPRFRDAFAPRIAALDLEALTAAPTIEEATP